MRSPGPRWRLKLPVRLAALGPRARFALLSGVLVVIVGVFVVVQERGAARDEAIAGHESAVAARLGTVSLPPGRLSEGDVTHSQRRVFARAVAEVDAEGGEASVRLFDRARRVALAAGPRIKSSPAAVRRQLDRALTGEVGSTVFQAGGERVSTLVPIRAGDSERPAGAIEVRVPWTQVAAGGGGGGSTLALLIPLGVLAVLWAALQGIATLGTHSTSRASGPSGDAQIDSLTELPNRGAFRDLLEQAMIAGRRDNGVVCVLLMDLDRFKEVNDTLGHYNGDMLLKRVGPRLRTVLREADTVARLGGDEFAVLMPGLPDHRAVVAAAQRVSEVFADPFVLGGLSLEVEASVGIALYPEHGSRVDILLHRADTAMYAAKRSRSGLAVYSDEQEQGSRRRLALASELRRAIAEDEIGLLFQPKARFSTGQIAGVEALARWNHPTQGIISPTEFIPIAEQTSQLHALTEQILERALDQLREWHKRGFELTVAVNLSMRNLLDATLADQVARLLDRKGIDGSWLELELTESMLMSDPRRAKEVLFRLKEVGVRLSVDDFGTGYSSLAYLKDLPVDTIKIDKSFVMSMDKESRNAAIVRATIDLGRNLGLDVVAEGVETQASYDELARLGCDYAQGYLLAKPLPAGNVLARVSDFRSNPMSAPAAEPDDEEAARPLRAVPSESASV